MLQSKFKILNADEAFGVVGKSVKTAFVQKALVAKQEQQVRRQRALKVLSHAASRSASPQLELIAASMQFDVFTKVKEEIDAMDIELTEQQEDEIAHRDWGMDTQREHPFHCFCLRLES